LTKETLESISSLNTFIKKNSSLHHLDMRQCGLSDPMIRLLVTQGVSESQGLMAVHFCGNPGISRELICDIQLKLGSKDPFVPENHIQGLGKVNDGELNSFTVQETLLLKSIIKNKKLHEVDLDIPTSDKQKLFLER
jgi:hypothetical protein